VMACWRASHATSLYSETKIASLAKELEDDIKAGKHQPLKSKADRILKRLRKDGKTKQDLGKWVLTDAGEKAAKKAADSLGNSEAKPE
jgi:ABC-type amino acid transport substrate-binding protein